VGAGEKRGSRTDRPGRSGSAGDAAAARGDQVATTRRIGVSCVKHTTKTVVRSPRPASIPRQIIIVSPTVTHSEAIHFNDGPLRRACGEVLVRKSTKGRRVNTA